MKAPLSWLKEYVDIDCTPEELQAKLFSCGFEVEEMLYYGEKIDKIVTCKILEITKHPNADKLSVTKIDAGKYGVLQIVTSATNIFVGAVVPVALDGATLFNGERIFNGELRGVESNGMFCSGEELGINDDWYSGASVNGILILDEKFPLGESVKDLLEIGDVIFDINVTANRPDCQSILGIAREVAAVLGKPLKMPDLSFRTCNEKDTVKTVCVKNAAYDLCPRYKAHYVFDVTIGESPLWLKRRLFSVGLRSVNNVVDITNYVLMEIGQPMHAFDLKNLSGSVIEIRRALNGEKIITLDEKEFTLTADNLVICDDSKPVALAGIMGGLNSEIKNDTTDVVFESARFARDNVRKTSRQLGQRSDSSSRFEKGVDFYSVELGLKRALNLIDTLGCGKVAAGEYDLHEQEIKEKTIETSVSKICGVLGIDIPVNEIVGILNKLSFGTATEGDKITVTVPLYREDMESYPDIAEEIIREYGYDNIVPTLLKTSSITAGGLNEKQRKIAEMKNLLVSQGFYETITYSFVSEKEFELFGASKEGTVKLLNPLSEDIAVMRKMLIPSTVRAVAYNLKRKNNAGRLFELAKVYTACGKDVLPKEENRLSLAIFGDGEDFFTLKGVIENILDVFCFERSIKYVRSNAKYLHPTRSADVFVNDEYVGSFGQLIDFVADEYDIDKPVYAAELNYEKMSELFNDKIIVQPISKFPAIDRDLAVTVDENVTCAQITDVIKSAGGEFLNEVKLFDVYTGDQVDKGKKSMAFSLNFSSLDRTLKVQEVDEAIKNILNCLRNSLNAELR